jgi:hypothetical protein
LVKVVKENSQHLASKCGRNSVRKNRVKGVVGDKREEEAEETR